MKTDNPLTNWDPSDNAVTMRYVILTYNLISQINDRSRRMLAAVQFIELTVMVFVVLYIIGFLS